VRAIGGGTAWTAERIGPILRRSADPTPVYRDGASAMTAEPTIKLRVDSETPATAGKRAAELRSAILNEAPGAVITRERDDPDAQEVGSVLVIVVSHIAVTGIMEGVRFLWEKYREPVIVELPDGSTIAVKGSSTEFLRSLNSLLGGGIDAAGGH
jgi:hypothetical protein